MIKMPFGVMITLEYTIQCSVHKEQTVPKKIYYVFFYPNDEGMKEINGEIQRASP